MVINIYIEVKNMEQYKIDRINELARKAKADGLSEEEIAERDVLRKEYIASVRRNFESQLKEVAPKKEEE